MSEAILTGDIKKAFEFSSNLIDRGKDIKEVINNVATFYRDLLSVKINAYNFGPHYKAEAQNYTEKQLVDIIDIFAEAQKDLRISDQERLTFELAFLKAIEYQNKEPEKQVVIEKIIEKEVVKQPANLSENNIPERPPLKVKQPSSVSSVSTTQTGNNTTGPKRQIDFDKHILGFWKKYINFVKSWNVSLGQCLQDGVPTAYENEVLTITFKYGKEFQLDVCKKSIDALEEALLMCYKTPIRVRLDLFPKPEEVIVPDDEEVKIVPPDLSEGAPVIEEVPPVDSPVKSDKDLEVIDSVTIDNSALNNLEQEQNDNLETSFENEQVSNDINNVSALEYQSSIEDITEPTKEEEQAENISEISKPIEENISKPVEEKIDTSVSVSEISNENKTEQADEFPADSPLLDQQYDDHPKLEEVLSLFPDATVETIRNK